MAGLFSTLNTGSLGLQAMQDALNVSSHNVANANTEGYTRERVDLEAVGGTNVSIDDASTIKIGTGVTVQDITRIRDSMNDYQVREATSGNSTLTTASSYLSQIQNIMNEPSGTGISSLINTFYSDWSSASTAATTNSSARTTLVQGTKTLTDALNNVANQLQTLKANAQTSIQNQIVNVNTQLNEVDNLNNNIMNMSSTGATPNDLEDQRDVLLDKLSQSFNITTTNGSLNGTALTAATSTAGSSTTAQTTLINPTNPSSENRLAYISDIQTSSGATTLIYYKNGDTSSASNKVTLTVTGATSDELNQLEENRVLVTNNDGTINGTTGTTTNSDGSTTGTIDIGSLTTLNSADGVFKGLTQTQQSIDSQTDELNNVAKAIALTVNTVESGKTDATQDSQPFFVNSSVATYTQNSNGNSILDPSYVTNANINEQNITAANISINSEILDDPSKIIAGTNGSGDGTTALAISQLANLNLDIQDMTATDSRAYFANNAALVKDSNGVSTLPSSSNGMTTSTYFTNSITNLGGKTSKVNSDLKTSTSVLNALTQTRTSTSGVSIDEEMTNLIQYQHAYQANAKIISTVSDLLDAVIGLIK